MWLVTAQTSKLDEASPFALKVQAKRDLLNEGQEAAAVREKNVMESLIHPFIIQMHATYQDDHFLYTVMEFVQGGELFSIMHSEQGKIPLSESQARFYGFAIADALACMHRKGIAYRDLKPENVLIDSAGYPKIIDFGFARKLEDKSYTMCGTPGYVVLCSLASKH